MKRHPIIGSILLVVLAWGCGNELSPEPPREPSPTVEAPTSETLQRLTDALRERSGAPGALLGVARGDQRFSFAAGSEDLLGQRPMSTARTFSRCTPWSTRLRLEPSTCRAHGRMHGFAYDYRATILVAMNRRVAILAFDGCQSLDVLGPLEVFHGASVRLREQASLSPSYEPLIVGFTGHAVRSESGARIMPDQTLQALLASGEPALDTWIVPGGHGVESLLEDRAAISEIAQVARTARRTGSVCTGAFLLGAAGLLHGRRATTHWAYCAELARAFPAVEVDTDSIFVRDGEVFSSAGVTAGIDLSLALVEDDLGHELASQVAKWLVVYVRRTGAEPQISGPLAVQAAARPGMRELATWVTAHSSEDLSVGALARRAGMSVRNFARVFREELHETPSSFVERVRTTSARRLMDTTDKSIEEIAGLVGFASATALRQAFRRCFGQTPTELRATRTT